MFLQTFRQYFIFIFLHHKWDQSKAFWQILDDNYAHAARSRGLLLLCYDKCTHKILTVNRLQKYHGRTWNKTFNQNVNFIVLHFRKTKGKIVVMNCWYITCSMCVKEMPELNKLVKKYKNNPNLTFKSKTCQRAFSPAVIWNQKGANTPQPTLCIMCVGFSRASMLNKLAKKRNFGIIRSKFCDNQILYSWKLVKYARY